MSGEGSMLRISMSRECRSRTIEKEKDWDLIQVLKRIGAPVEGVIVLSDGSPLPLDHPIDELESITVINVASGG